MTAWIVRAGASGQRDNWALTRGVAGGGFPQRAPADFERRPEPRYLSLKYALSFELSSEPRTGTRVEDSMNLGCSVSPSDLGGGGASRSSASPSAAATALTLRNQGHARVG